MSSLRSLAFSLCSAIRRARALSCAALHCFPDIISGRKMASNDGIKTATNPAVPMCSLLDEQYTPRKASLLVRKGPPLRHRFRSDGPYARPFLLTTVSVGISIGGLAFSSRWIAECLDGVDPDLRPCSSFHNNGRLLTLSRKVWFQVHEPYLELLRTKTVIDESLGQRTQNLSQFGRGCDKARGMAAQPDGTAPRT
jgi:hypothetical protein